MAKICGMGALLCLALSGVAQGATVNSPSMPDYVLPSKPDLSDERLRNDGIIWAQGSLLSSPCSSGRILATPVGDDVNSLAGRPVSILLEGCGDGEKGGGAALPVGIKVWDGDVFQSSGQVYPHRLAHGKSSLIVGSQRHVGVLRVEMRYE